MSAKLFVGNLSFNVTENDLQDAFAAHGTVVETNLMLDRATGRSRGFAFITMASDEEAAGAMLLSLQDSDTARSVDSEGVPTGTTIMEIPVPNEEKPLAGPEKADKAEAARKAAGNTSSAAKAILEKYMRRPRS